MPNKASAAKALRQAKARTLKNREVKNKIKKLRKAVRVAIAAGKASDAAALLPQFSKTVDKAAKRHVIHGNRANRLKSSVSRALLRAGTK